MDSMVSIRWPQRDNPLAVFLPLRSLQAQVYRLNELPPFDPRLADHGPAWQVISFNFAANDAQELRVALQPDFHLIAVGIFNSVNNNGGFRAQFFDRQKKRRLADRGLQEALMGGLANGPTLAYYYLREPYAFDQPNAELLVSAQNLEPAANAVQISLYGVARPDWVYGNSLAPK
jgi:hypothetical protein